MLLWGKRVWKALVAGAEVYGLASSQFFTVVVIPIGMGAAVMAYFDGMDRTTIYLVAIAAFSIAAFGFAAISVGVLRISEWRDKNRMEGKLIFTGPMVARDIDIANKIAVIQIGAYLKNTSHFPISYIVDEIRTSADNTVPARGTINSRSGVIQAQVQEYYRDRPIDLHEPKQKCEGKLEIKLRYGHAGQEKYEMAHSVDIEVHHDTHSGTTLNWLYAPRNDAN